jgi:predicted NUDIX family phosphoesterase
MNISTINNLTQLANFLRCDDVFLKAYLKGDFTILDHKNGFSLPTTTGYTSIIDKLYLRKRNKHLKAYREVYSVRTDTLKNILKGLSTFLKQSHSPSTAVHGYVQGKNIRTNAERHLSKRHLLSVDISNFFGTISEDMVRKAFLSIGFSSFAVEYLAKIVTLNNFLPPGYSTSPIISNMVVNEMDEELLQLCGRDCIYTRYADDLYFSSNISRPNLENISTIVTKYGFDLNPDKTKYMPRGVKQYVTGLTVFDHLRPRITKRTKRNLRLELHYLLAYGLRGHALKKMGKTINDYFEDDRIRSEVDEEVERIDKRITGWLRFMNSVESNAAKKFIAEYKKVTL